MTPARRRADESVPRGLSREGDQYDDARRSGRLRTVAAVSQSAGLGAVGPAGPARFTANSERLLVAGSQVAPADPFGGAGLTEPLQSDRSRRGAADSPDAAVPSVLRVWGGAAVAVSGPYQDHGLSQPLESGHTEAARGGRLTGGSYLRLCGPDVDGCGFDGARSEYGLSFRCPVAAQAGSQGGEGADILQKGGAG